MFINRQLFVFTLVLHQIFGTGFAGVIMRSFGNCDPNGYDLFKYNLSIKTVNKSQYLSGTLSMLEPFSNSFKRIEHSYTQIITTIANLDFSNLQSTTDIEILTGKEYVYLFTIRERKACDALHKYLGEFMYDIERGMGHIPRVCPIPKNTYYVYNLPIDASKITTISNFPFGNLRVTVHLRDKENSEVCCLKSVIENNLLH